MIKPSQSIAVGFETARFDTGAATNADTLPTGILVRNGTDTAVSVTVANKAAGSYKATFTVPADAAAGDVFELRVEAAVNGVSGKATVWRDVSDTKRTSDLQDLTVVQIRTEIDANSTQLAAAQAILEKMDGMLELDGALYRFTVAALANAPSGGEGGFPLEDLFGYNEFTSDDTVTLALVLKVMWAYMQGNVERVSANEYSVKDADGTQGDPTSGTELMRLNVLSNGRTRSS